MQTLLSGFGLAMLVTLGMAAVLALLLVEIRCLVRLIGRIATHPARAKDEPPGFFTDIQAHHSGHR